MVPLFYKLAPELRAIIFEYFMLMQLDSDLIPHFTKVLQDSGSISKSISSQQRKTPALLLVCQQFHIEASPIADSCLPLYLNVTASPLPLKFTPVRTPIRMHKAPRNVAISMLTNSRWNSLDASHVLQVLTQDTPDLFSHVTRVSISFAGDLNDFPSARRLFPGAYDYLAPDVSKCIALLPALNLFYLVFRFEPERPLPPNYFTHAQMVRILQHMLFDELVRESCRTGFRVRWGNREEDERCKGFPLEGNYSVMHSLEREHDKFFLVDLFADPVVCGERCGFGARSRIALCGHEPGKTPERRVRLWFGIEEDAKADLREQIRQGN